MNMNIAEILKDCPTWTKLYSPLFGEVKLIEVNSEDITVRTYKSNNAYFDEQGRYKIGYNNSECLLFPSKDNRDWSTFKIPKKECEFKPFDKVLVRDENSTYWRADLFSHYNPDCNDDYYYCTIGYGYKQCIPYEGNEHLLGTTNNPN